jgi:hypothetical protein
LLPVKVACFGQQQVMNALQPGQLNPLGGLGNFQWEMQGLIKDLT